MLPHAPSIAYRKCRASLARGNALFFHALRRKALETYFRRAVLGIMWLLERSVGCTVREEGEGSGDSAPKLLLQLIFCIRECCCPRRRMRWSGVTGAIARCKNKSTGYVHEPRSAPAWRWTCGKKPKGQGVTKPSTPYMRHKPRQSLLYEFGELSRPYPL